MQVLKHLQEKERERRGGVGGAVGEIGETLVFNKNYRFFAEDISNHPLGVYTGNISLRVKVLLVDEIM